jgi:hypothetical protein
MKEVLSIFTFGIGALCFVGFVTVFKPTAVSAVDGTSKPEYLTSRPLATDRTSFAPETTSPKHDERDRTQTKTQQNQQSGSISGRSPRPAHWSSRKPLLNVAGTAPSVASSSDKACAIVVQGGEA